MSDTEAEQPATSAEEQTTSAKEKNGFDLSNAIAKTKPFIAGGLALLDFAIHTRGAPGVSRRGFPLVAFRCTSGFRGGVHAAVAIVPAGRILHGLRKCGVRLIQTGLSAGRGRRRSAYRGAILINAWPSRLMLTGSACVCGGGDLLDSRGLACRALPNPVETLLLCLFKLGVCR